MLMRYDPFVELERLTDRLFNTVANRPLGIPLDAYREGDKFVVRADIPGVDPEAIEVTVDHDTLSISAERKWEPGEGTEVFVSERPHGKFTRQLFLGESLDTERMEAHYENGVLTLVIPVAEAARPKRIPVASGSKDHKVLEASAQA
jgi:HSP20 family protein